MRKYVLFPLFLVAVLFSSTKLVLAFDLKALEVHGFVSQGYLRSTDNNYLAKTEDGTTEFNDVAINVSTTLADKLRVGCQFLARDLGDAGNNKVVLDWGYGDYHFRDEIGIRIGKVKRPMGFYNEGRDVDMLRTWVLLPQSVYREDYRDISNAAKGGSIYGTMPAGQLGSFDYQQVYGSKDLDLESTVLRKQFQNFFPGVDTDDIYTEIKYTNTSHVIWNTSINGLRFGGSYETGRVEASAPAVQDIPTSDPGIVIPGQPARSMKIDLKRILMASVEYRKGNLTLTAEYLDTIQKFTTDSEISAPVIQETHSIGYYGSIDYRLTDWFVMSVYYSEYYPDKDDKHGRKQALYGRPDYMGWQKDSCLSLRFDPCPGWVCKLEGHSIDGAAQVFDYQTPDEVEERWSLFASKITFSF